MDEPDRGGSRRGPLLGLLRIVLLVGAGLWLTHRLSEVGGVQDCVATGGRDCGRAATPAH